MNSVRSGSLVCKIEGSCPEFNSQRLPDFHFPLFLSHNALFPA